MFSSETRDDVLSISIGARKPLGCTILGAVDPKDRSRIHDLTQLVDVVQCAAAATLPEEVVDGARRQHNAAVSGVLHRLADALDRLRGITAAHLQPPERISKAEIEILSARCLDEATRTVELAHRRERAKRRKTLGASGVQPEASTRR